MLTCWLNKQEGEFLLHGITQSSRLPMFRLGLIRLQLELLKKVTEESTGRETKSLLKEGS
jgi:hypothetical protein